MKWNYQELALEQINIEDTTFDWYLSEPSEELLYSLKANGLLMPLIVKPSDKEFSLLDGFKRVRAFYQGVLGSTKNLSPTYPCLILSNPATFEQLATWRIETCHHQNHWSGMQICQILSLLYEDGIDESIIIEKFLPKFGFKPSKKTNQELLELTTLSENMNAQLLQGFTCDELFPLLHFSQKDVEILMEALIELKIKGNKWKELIRLFYECNRVLKSDLPSLLTRVEIQQILRNSNLQPPLRYQHLKKQLEKWRYPEITATRQKFEQEKNKLKLSPHSSVECDPYFEKDNLTVKVQASSFDELETQFRFLNQTLSSTSWQAIFRLIQGEGE